MNTNKSRHNIQEEPRFGFTRWHAVLAAVITSVAMISIQCDKKKPAVPQVRTLANTSNKDWGIQNLAEKLIGQKLAQIYIPLSGQISSVINVKRYMITRSPVSIKIQVTGTDSHFEFDDTGSILTRHRMTLMDISDCIRDISL